MEKDGETVDVANETIGAWREAGLTLKDEMERMMQEMTSVEYGRLMRKVWRPRQTCLP
jgi:hypothetical protein